MASESMTSKGMTSTGMAVRLEGVSYAPLGRMVLHPEIQLACARGDSLAIIGRSGAGKTTLGRILAGLAVPTRGFVCWDETHGDSSVLAPRIQMIFQYPARSLDPRRRVRAIIAETLPKELVEDSSRCRDDAIEQALDEVRVQASLASCYPHELSGGQCQRLAIARALAARPLLLVADEPTASLDSHARGGVLNLLARINRAGTTLVVISHDVRVLPQLCTRYVLLESGRLAAQGGMEALHAVEALQRS